MLFFQWNIMRFSLGLWEYAIFHLVIQCPQWILLWQQFKSWGAILGHVQLKFSLPSICRIQQTFAEPSPTERNASQRHILDSRICLFTRPLLYFYHWIFTVEITTKIVGQLLLCTQNCWGLTYEEMSDAEIKIIVRFKYEIGSLWLLLKLRHRMNYRVFKRNINTSWPIEIEFPCLTFKA